MIVRRSNLLVSLVLAILLVFSVNPAAAAKPIVLGCPLSTAYLYGWDAERAITLAVEEINAAGGVKVGKKMRPFKVEVIDTRDLEPGVPVSEALLAVEKLILNKRADFILGRTGPIRSGPGSHAAAFQVQEGIYSDHRSPDPQVSCAGGRAV